MKGTRLDIAHLSTVFPSTDRPSGNLLGVDHTTSYRFYGRYFTKVVREKTFPKEKQQSTHILHTGFYCFKHVFIFWHSKILFPTEVVAPCFSYFFLKKRKICFADRLSAAVSGKCRLKWNWILQQIVGKSQKDWCNFSPYDFVLICTKRLIYLKILETVFPSVSYENISLCTKGQYSFFCFIESFFSFIQLLSFNLSPGFVELKLCKKVRATRSDSK